MTAGVFIGKFIELTTTVLKNGNYSPGRAE